MKIPMSNNQAVTDVNDKLYDDFVLNKYPAPKLVIDVDNLDFQHNKRDLGRIVDQIDSELFGLFADSPSLSN